MANSNTAHLHRDDLNTDNYDTNEYDTCDEGNGPFRNESGCPSESVHPAWCHRKGDLALRGPDGLLYPARAFGPNGLFTAEQVSLCGVFNDHYDGGVFDGREYGACKQLPSCAPCTTFYTCAGVTAKLAAPASLAAKTLLKMAVDPALAGTTLEGNFGDLCLEPSTDAEDPLNVGVVESSTKAYVLQDDGTYAADESMVSEVCAFVGVDLKSNGQPAEAAEEAPAEEGK